MKWSASNSGRAEADLTHQYRWYLDQDGQEVAERFLNAFDTTIEQLLKMPTIGRLRRFRAACDAWGARSGKPAAGSARKLSAVIGSKRTKKISLLRPT